MEYVYIWRARLPCRQAPCMTKGREGTLAAEWTSIDEMMTCANSFRMFPSSQLVWATTNRVGCAVHTCPRMDVWGEIWENSIYLVCNYSPK